MSIIDETRSARPVTTAHMYKAIVVGTDGSPTAEEAVRCAAALADLCSAQLTVVSAYQPMSAAGSLTMSGAAMGLGFDAAELVEDQRLLAEEALEHAVMTLTTKTPARTVALAGGAAEVLLAVAAEVAADLIVVGNVGMQGKQRFLLGSVPNRVAHHADCSVLIVQTS